MRQTYIISVAHPQCPTRPPERIRPKINRSGQRFLQPADGLTRCRWQLGEAAHPKACRAAGSCELLLCPGARRIGGPISAKQVRADWHFALDCLAQSSLASRQSGADRWHVACCYLVEMPQHAPPRRLAFSLFIKSIWRLKPLRCWMQLKHNHCWRISLNVLFLQTAVYTITNILNQMGNLRIVHISLLKTKYCSTFVCILRESRLAKIMTHSYKSREKKIKSVEARKLFHTWWRHMTHHSLVIFITHPWQVFFLLYFFCLSEELIISWRKSG